eukprot:3941214-Rhodomonas_salina.4
MPSTDLRGIHGLSKYSRGPRGPDSKRRQQAAMLHHGPPGTSHTSQRRSLPRPCHVTLSLGWAVAERGRLEPTFLGTDRNVSVSHWYWLITCLLRTEGGVWRCIVTNHDARFFPSLYHPRRAQPSGQRAEVEHEEGGAEQEFDQHGQQEVQFDQQEAEFDQQELKFDRVLCDVPCSGDGTAPLASYPLSGTDICARYAISGADMHTCYGISGTSIVVRALSGTSIVLRAGYGMSGAEIRSQVPYARHRTYGHAGPTR